LRHALLSAETHIRLTLAGSALPREKAEQRQDGALKDALARKATILLMTTSGTGPHENLDGL
jgi:hypothetical protein